MVVLVRYVLGVLQDLVDERAHPHADVGSDEVLEAEAGQRVLAADVHLEKKR